MTTDSCQFILTVDATHGVRVRTGVRAVPGTVIGLSGSGQPVTSPVAARVLAVGFDPDSHTLDIALEAETED